MEPESTNRQSQIYLGLGTNQGDRLANLQAVVSTLPPEVTVLAQSPVYRTPPWGFVEQPDFLNQVLVCGTALPPLDLLAYVKRLEAEIGRQETFRWGPREIDIDILDYGGMIENFENLTLPHPRLHERAFMLVPLASVDPAWRHPALKKTAAELVAQLPPEEIAEYQGEMTMTTPTRLEIKGHEFVWGSRTYVMGIVNVTPDSFSGDGLIQGQDAVEAALTQAREFAAQGAHILDVGGESTRPGSEPVGAAEEIDRVIPVVEAIAGEIDLPISIDTYKAEVAAAALEAGAGLINDVWGCKADPEMAPLAAERGVPVILMHNRSTPKNAEVQARLGGRYLGMEYEDLIEDIKRELLESVEIVRSAGVVADHIILDTGIGFGKTVDQNLELLNRTDEIRRLGYPVLIGSSRKSFIGYTLDLPPDQRVEGTAATVAVAVMRGADIVRVHDVGVMARVARMTDAIVR